MKINYLIAAWFGPRRSDNRPGYEFLDKHLIELRKLDHNLAQITIILPDSKENKPELIERFSSIGRIGNTPVVLLQRENDGLSYGSWSYAYDQYLDKFDYYILIEDDYVFVKPNFDSIMLNLINLRRCGYLCSLYENVSKKNRINWKPHASVSNGIAKEVAFASVKKLHGKLPYVSGHGYVSQSQVNFSAAIIEAGFSICDFSEEYAVPYYKESNQTIVNYGRGTENLIVPIQMLEGKQNISQ